MKEGLKVRDILRGEAKNGYFRPRFKDMGTGLDIEISEKTVFVSDYFHDVGMVSS